MERLSDTDLVYFQTAMGGLEKARAIVDFVQSILIPKHNLKNGDDIMLDGRIIRLEDKLNAQANSGSAGAGESEREKQAETPQRPN